MDPQRRTCKKCAVEKAITDFPLLGMNGYRRNACKICFYEGRKKVPRICEWCSTPFKTTQDQVNRGGGRFCSIKCTCAFGTEQIRTPDRGRAHRLARRKQNRQRENAHGKVRYAVLKGRLVRGRCVVCGAEKVDAHHEDYSKPLDVIWLCRQHHRDWERGLVQR